MMAWFELQQTVLRGTQQGGRTTQNSTALEQKEFLCSGTSPQYVTTRSAQWEEISREPKNRFKTKREFINNLRSATKVKTSRGEEVMVAAATHLPTAALIRREAILE